MSAGTQDLLILLLIFSIATLGLDLVVGYTRIFSISQALLFGVGAFGFAFTANHLDSSKVLVAWAIAIPAAALISLAVALISLRVQGDYFVVASFGTQLIGLQVLFNWTAVSGGPAGAFGLPYPSIFGWTPSDLPGFLVLVAIVAAICYAGVTYLLLSPYGRLLRALGNDEAALSAAGFNTSRIQIGAFVLGGSLAAIAGVLYAAYNGVAQVSDFSLDVSISLLAMVVVGGAGRVVGGFLGAAMLVLIPHVLDRVGLASSTAGSVKQLVFGGLLLAIVVFVPSGITGAAANVTRRLRRGRGRSSALEAGGA